jgi:hypothetical protein
LALGGFHKISEDESNRTKIQWNLQTATVGHGCVEGADDLVPDFRIWVCKSGLVEFVFEQVQEGNTDFSAKVWISDHIHNHDDQQLVPVETSVKHNTASTRSFISFQLELDPLESIISIHLKTNPDDQRNARLFQFDFEYTFLLPKPNRNLLIPKRQLLKTRELSDYLSMVPISSMYHPSIPSSPVSSSSDSSFQESLLWDDCGSSDDVCQLKDRFTSCSLSDSSPLELCFPALDLVI